MNLLEADFEETPSIKNILTELGLTEEQYYNPLAISSGSDFQIHIKRATNACFVNNIFAEGFQVWKANIECNNLYHLVLFGTKIG